MMGINGEEDNMEQNDDSLDNINNSEIKRRFREQSQERLWIKKSLEDLILSVKAGQAIDIALKPETIPIKHPVTDEIVEYTCFDFAGHESVKISDIKSIKEKSRKLSNLYPDYSQMVVMRAQEPNLDSASKITHAEELLLFSDKFPEDIYFYTILYSKKEKNESISDISAAFELGLDVKHARIKNPPINLLMEDEEQMKLEEIDKYFQIETPKYLAKIRKAQGEIDGLGVFRDTLGEELYKEKLESLQSKIKAGINEIKDIEKSKELYINALKSPDTVKEYVEENDEWAEEVEVAEEAYSTPLVKFEIFDVGPPVKKGTEVLELKEQYEKAEFTEEESKGSETIDKNTEEIIADDSSVFSGQDEYDGDFSAESKQKIGQIGQDMQFQQPANEKLVNENEDDDSFSLRNVSVEMPESPSGAQRTAEFMEDIDLNLPESGDKGNIDLLSTGNSAENSDMFRFVKDKEFLNQKFDEKLGEKIDMDVAFVEDPNALPVDSNVEVLPDHFGRGGGDFQKAAPHETEVTRQFKERRLGIGSSDLAGLVEDVNHKEPEQLSSKVAKNMAMPKASPAEDSEIKETLYISRTLKGMFDSADIFSVFTVSNPAEDEFGYITHEKFPLSVKEVAQAFSDEAIDKEEFKELRRTYKTYLKNLMNVGEKMILYVDNTNYSEEEEQKLENLLGYTFYHTGELSPNNAIEYSAVNSGGKLGFKKKEMKNGKILPAKDVNYEIKEDIAGEVKQKKEEVDEAEFAEKIVAKTRLNLENELWSNGEKPVKQIEETEIDPVTRFRKTRLKSEVKKMKFKQKKSKWYQAGWGVLKGLFVGTVVTLGFMGYDKVSEKVNQMENRIEIVQDQNVSLQNKIDELIKKQKDSEEIKAVQPEIQKIIKKYETIQNVYVTEIKLLKGNHEDYINKLDSVKKGLSELIKSADKSDLYKQKFDDIGKNLTSLDKNYAKTLKQLADVQKAVKDVETSIAGVKNLDELNALGNKLGKKLEGIKSNYKNLETQINEIKKKLTTDAGLVKKWEVAYQETENYIKGSGFVYAKASNLVDKFVVMLQTENEIDEPTQRLVALELSKAYKIEEKRFMEDNKNYRKEWISPKVIKKVFDKYLGLRKIDHKKGDKEAMFDAQQTITYFKKK